MISLVISDLLLRFTMNKTNNSLHELSLVALECIREYYSGTSKQISITDRQNSSHRGYPYTYDIIFRTF